MVDAANIGADLWSTPDRSFFLTDERLLLTDVSRIAAMRQRMTDGTATPSEIRDFEQEQATRTARMTEGIDAFIDLLQAGEADVDLELAAGYGDGPYAGMRPGHRRRVQQHRLTHTRGTSEHHGITECRRPIHERAQQGDLLIAPDQGQRAIGPPSAAVGKPATSAEFHNAGPLRHARTPQPTSRSSTLESASRQGQVPSTDSSHSE
jgi:hypothetical protein